MGCPASTAMTTWSVHMCTNHWESSCGASTQLVSLDWTSIFHSLVLKISRAIAGCSKVMRP